MKTRTWPYGTRKTVEVAKVVRSHNYIAILCVEDDAPKEGYICLFRPNQIAAEEGQRGTLTFTEGGATGGYWQFVAKDGNQDALAGPNIN